VNLFVDISALFAIRNAEDGNHRSAFAAPQRLLIGCDTPHTSNYVIV
jgi:predicted nucleic acid-binding protein